MALTVVILAAGQGKRMNSDLPKVLQPLAGRPILAHVIDTARSLGADQINIVFGHGGEAVQAAFEDEDLSWSLQAEQLGTGHALAQALPAIPDDHQVLVLYGDVPLITPASLAPLLSDDSSDALVVLTAILDDPRGYGRVIRAADGMIKAIVEERDASDEERAIQEVSTGLIRMQAGKLRNWLHKLSNNNAQGEYYLTDIVAMAETENVAIVGVLASDSSVVGGINQRSELAVAERLIQKRNAENAMQQGVTLADPARFDLRGELSTGRDVFIDVGVVLEGDIELADGVRIGPHSVIRNSRLGARCLVHANSILDGVVAGADCEMGPFARLRPGTELAERVKIGNFVEVKASQIEAGSKANHLSYVGDSSVGSSVNIGAGTIVCNYDGAVKSRTVIGERAFIGSGVMLVAPVEIGSGATIGAGSTVSKDAPPNELTVARARQTVVKGWIRPTKPVK